MRLSNKPSKKPLVFMVETFTGNAIASLHSLIPSYECNILTLYPKEKYDSTKLNLFPTISNIIEFKDLLDINIPRKSISLNSEKIIERLDSGSKLFCKSDILPQTPLYREFRLNTDKLLSKIDEIVDLTTTKSYEKIFIPVSLDALGLSVFLSVLDKIKDFSSFYQSKFNFYTDIKSNTSQLEKLDHLCVVDLKLLFSYSSTEFDNVVLSFFKDRYDLLYNSSLDIQVLKETLKLFQFIIN